MHPRRFLALILCLGPIASLPAAAADRSILGKSMTVSDPTGGESRRSVVLLGRETGTDVPAMSDPTVGGATLTVTTGGVRPSASRSSSTPPAGDGSARSGSSTPGRPVPTTTR